MMVRERPIEWPDLEHYSDTPIFNTKAVVQQTEVPAPTLRAWERRYTLISPERANNTYRLYSERDIVLIRWLKERVDDGISISQAIALFRHMNDEYQQLAHHQKQHASELLVESHPAFQIAVTSPAPQTEPRSEEGERQKPYQEIMSSSIQSPPPCKTFFTQQYPTLYNMQIVREQLINAFQHFDETTAQVIMGSTLAIYSVEQVCAELITPTLWQIGQLWAEGHLTVLEEHFASNFFRALLVNLLHLLPNRHNRPIVAIGSAPGEPHELASLMLALFLRRSGIHVIYLGQSIEITGLISLIKKLTPAMICISLTMPDYLPALIKLGRQVQNIQPHPTLVFGGQVFTQYANIIPQIPGLYLKGDLREITMQLCSMLLEGPENNA